MKPKKDEPKKLRTGKSFKKTGEGFTSLNEGEQIEGTFLRRRNVTITDRLTHERKNIYAYDLKLADGSIASISGRALLDDAFNDVFDAYGTRLNGLEIAIIRGEDVDTPTEGNRMGTYEVLVYE